MDYPWYQTLDEMQAKADLVMTGKVVSIRQEIFSTSSDPTQKDPYTIYTLEPIEVYKGEIKCEVEIKVYGGVMDGKIYVSAEDSEHPMEEGKSYLVFLSTYENVPASLMNPIQAHYELDKDGEVICREDQPEFVITDLLK